MWAFVCNRNVNVLHTGFSILVENITHTFLYEIHLVVHVIFVGGSLGVFQIKQHCSHRPTAMTMTLAIERDASDVDFFRTTGVSWAGTFTVFLDKSASVRARKRERRESSSIQKTPAKLHTVLLHGDSRLLC